LRIEWPNRVQVGHNAVHSTELLEQILARDATAASATTLQREQHDPAIQLGHATTRYLDALHVAAEHIADLQMIADVDHDADQLINGLTKEAAWPPLRTRLLLLALAYYTDPVATLREAAQLQELDSAADCAAVLNWRLATPNSTTQPPRCRGCPAYPLASPNTPNGDPT
jgi:hypothetical protein